jgi:hypothetical protein
MYFLLKDLHEYCNSRSLKVPMWKLFSKTLPRTLFPYFNYYSLYCCTQDISMACSELVIYVILLPVGRSKFYTSVTETLY